MKLPSTFLAAAIEGGAASLSKPALLLGERLGSVLSPSRIEYFTQRLYDRASRWAPLHQESEALMKAVSDTNEMRVSAQQHLHRVGITADLWVAQDLPALSQAVAKTTDAKAISEFERFAIGQHEQNRLFLDLSGKMDRRVHDLDLSVNYDMRRLGMPRIRVHTNIPDNIEGGYINGTLGVKRSSFLSASDSRMYETSAHELTHGEQQYLVTARHADMIGIGESASKSQGAELRSRMDALSMPLSGQTMHNFLRTRAGRHLTDEAAERAELLASAHHNLGLHFGERAELATRLDTIKAVSRARQLLPTEEFALGLLGKLFDPIEGPQLTRSIMGNSNQPLAQHEFLRAKFASIIRGDDSYAQFMRDDARRVAATKSVEDPAYKAFVSSGEQTPDLSISAIKSVEPALNRAITHDTARSISTFRKDEGAYFAIYHGSLHEMEAFGNGRIAADWVATARGTSERLR